MEFFAQLLTPRIEDKMVARPKKKFQLLDVFGVGLCIIFLLMLIFSIGCYTGYILAVQLELSKRLEVQDEKLDLIYGYLENVVNSTSYDGHFGKHREETPFLYLTTPESCMGNVSTTKVYDATSGKLRCFEKKSYSSDDPLLIRSKYGFGVGKKLLINGTINANAHRFQVNFRTLNMDIAFHYNPRLEQKKIFRNTWTSAASWGHEEHDGIFEFHKGGNFTLRFLAHEDEFQVHGSSLNVKLPLVTYKYRLNPDFMAYLDISGDVEVDTILIDGFSMCTDDEKCSSYRFGIDESSSCCEKACYEVLNDEKSHK